MRITDLKVASIKLLTINKDTNKTIKHQKQLSIRSLKIVLFSTS